MSTSSVTIRIVPATESDIPLILSFIRRLAEYERLADACVATEERIPDVSPAGHYCL